MLTVIACSVTPASKGYLLEQPLLSLLLCTHIASCTLRTGPAQSKCYSVYMMQEQYSADAESWSSEQAALQADLAALAAQTALKSLALDAMMRNSSRSNEGAGGHAVGGPLWQQVWPHPIHSFPHIHLVICLPMHNSKQTTHKVVILRCTSAQRPYTRSSRSWGGRSWLALVLAVAVVIGSAVASGLWACCFRLG